MGCEMKWVVIVVLVTLAKFGEGGALRCIPGADNPTCKEEELEKGECAIILQVPVPPIPSQLVRKDMECLPGSEWESNCHRCRCLDSGLAECLRQNCDQPYAEPIRCKPNSTFTRDCHTCVCLDNGQGLCTLENCWTPEQNPPKKSDLEEGKECAPGTSWKSQCNDCGCTRSGYSFCTEKACSDRENEPLMRCAPDSMWKNECNTCWCTFNGVPTCTKIGCVGSSEKNSTSTKSEGSSVNRPLPDADTDIQTDDDIEENLNRGEELNPHIEQKDFSLEPNDHVFETKESQENKSSENIVSLDYNDVDISRNSLKVLDTSYELIDDNIKELYEHKFGNEGILITEASESPDVNNDIGYENDLSGLELQDSSHGLLKEDAYRLYKHNDENEDLVIKANDRSARNINLVHNTVEDDQNHVEVLKEDTHKVLKRSVCKPNQSFQSECNTCKCAADGQSYTCTHNECMEGETNKEVEVFMENEGVDHIERHSVCKPRGTFYIGCNTCHCNLYGTDYSCTNKPCPLPEDVELFHELKIPKTSKNSTQKIVCVANRMFIKDCNTCWCNDDGTGFYCTRKVCVAEFPDDAVSDEDKPENLRIIKKECRPDEVFEMDCNMCRCNPDGKSFSCTRRLCLESTDDEIKNTTLSRKTRGVTQEAPKNCQPSQEFRLDCNTCLCDSMGKDFSCTRNDCNTVNHNGGGSRRKRDTSEQVTMECSPGSVFDRDCNVCRCTTDGHHATCTLKRCVQESQGNDDTAPVPEADPNFRCNPGEQFKRGCNDCSCSADGKSVFCTVRFCDQDITPPPSL